LEIVEWSCLADHRAKHEAAAHALSATLKGKDRDSEDQAVLALCDVTEGALRDLGENIDDGKSAYRAAVSKVEPKRGEPVGTPETIGLDYDGLNENAEKTNRHVREEEGKLRPKREALEQDLDRLRRVQGILKPNVLTEGRIVPTAQAELEAERQRVAKARAEAARKAEPLKQRIERLEAERANAA
jgi:hypothetical protein